MAAQPCSFEDAKKLKEIFATDVAISDDLLTAIIEKSNNVTRRVAVNLSRIQEQSYNDGTFEYSLKSWGNRAFFTGEAAPARG